MAMEGAHSVDGGEMVTEAASALVASANNEPHYLLERSSLSRKWDGPKKLNVEGRCNTYFNHRVLQIVKSELEACGVLDRFRASCFGHFLLFDPDVVFSGKLCLSLMDLEIVVPERSPYERVFLVGRHLLKFSKLEYCMYSGLRFGSSSFDPEVSQIPPENGIYNRHWPEQSVVANNLAQDFASQKFRDAPEDALKVAYILVATLYLFGVDDRTPVFSWMWSLVEDSILFNSFPWGAYVFQRSMHYLDQGLQPSSIGRIKTLYHIYGYPLPLQLWAFECIPEVGEALGEKINEELPRGLRWKFTGKRPNIPFILHKRDIRLADIHPTLAEMEKEYMIGINMDLSAGLQYVHHERPIGLKGSIGDGRRWRRSNTVRSRECMETTSRGRHKKRVQVRIQPQIVDQFDDGAETDAPRPPRSRLRAFSGGTPPPPFAPNPHISSGVPPPPSPLRPSPLGSSPPIPHEASLLEVHTQMPRRLKKGLAKISKSSLKDALKKVLPNILRDVLPGVLKQVLPDILRDIHCESISAPRQESVRQNDVRGHTDSLTHDDDDVSESTNPSLDTEAPTHIPEPH